MLKNLINNITKENRNFILLQISNNKFNSKNLHMASSDDKSLTEIDGSYLEGGGQILRISTAFSVLLNKPIKVVNIRKGRKDGGLKPQHLAGICLLAKLSNAKLIGGEIKSTQIEFTPTQLAPGNYLADTKTAGSITLLLQNALPTLIFGTQSSELNLRGGTNVDFSPQIDEFEQIFMPIVKQHFGIDLECKIVRKGYYPKGGGEVFVKTKPVKELKPLVLQNFGELKRIYGKAYVAGMLPIKIADRITQTVVKELRSVFKNVPIEIESVKEPDQLTIGTGSGVVIIAETTTGCLLSSSAIGNRHVQAEEVARKAASDIKKEIEEENCLDEHMQDQVIIFMALAKGESKFKCGEISLHTKTAIHYAELLTGAKFTITPDGKQNNTITCQGIGFTV